MCPSQDHLCVLVAVVSFSRTLFVELGGDSIDILVSLNPNLNPNLNHFSIQCLPKRVLNLVLKLCLNPSLKFQMSIELHP